MVDRVAEEHEISGLHIGHRDPSGGEELHSGVVGQVSPARKPRNAHQPGAVEAIFTLAAPAIRFPDMTQGLDRCGLRLR